MPIADMGGPASPPYPPVEPSPQQLSTHTVSGVGSAAGLRAASAVGAQTTEASGFASGSGAANAVPTGIASSAQLGELTVKAEVTVDREVIRAPFSESGIAELLAANPDFYQRLFRSTAEELKRDVARFEATPREGNSAAVISAELVHFQRGFETAAADLDSANADRFTRAAKTIVSIRDAIGHFCNNYPEIVQPFFEIAAVTAGCYVLHQIGGATGDVAALISYAIIRKEKLADLLNGADKKKDPPA
jgi:hypothetical protein